MSLIVTSVALLHSTALAMGADRHPNIWIQVTNLDTGMPIKRNKTFNSLGIPLEVTVTNYGADCAGQFVITAIGAPGFPPSVLVQFQAFIIGPSVGSNSVTADTIYTGVTPDGFNDIKITASCNGAAPHQKSFDFFEFFVEIPQ